MGSEHSTKHFFPFPLSKCCLFMNSAWGKIAQAGQYCSKASVFAQAEEKIPGWHLLLWGSQNAASSVLLGHAASRWLPRSTTFLLPRITNGQGRKALQIRRSEASRWLAGVPWAITYQIKYFLLFSISSGGSCATTEQHWSEILLCNNRHGKA